jgi:hypothetical protein
MRMRAEAPRDAAGEEALAGGDACPVRGVRIREERREHLAGLPVLERDPVRVRAQRVERRGAGHRLPHIAVAERLLGHHEEVERLAALRARLRVALDLRTQDGRDGAGAEGEQGQVVFGDVFH